MSKPRFLKIVHIVGVLGIFVALLGGGPMQTESVVLATTQPQRYEELAPLAGTLRVSTSNPRYFTDDNGKVIYLTGSHTWANFQDIGYSNPPPIFDYTAYLNFLQARHHNFFRLWVWEQAKGSPWAKNIWVTPLPYQRTGPGTALDGGPKFDLTKFNQAYFDRLRNRIIQAGNRGIYVSVMLFDGWSVGKKLPSDPGNPWVGHPFNAGNNINGINGDPNKDGNGYEIDTLAIPAITAIQEAYVRKVVDTVNDLDNVLFEICNECNLDSTAWQYHMIDYIHNYEATKSKQHPVGMTVAYPDGNNTDLFNSLADWVSPNATGGYKDSPPVANGNKVVIVDTDHLWGEGGDRQWVWKSFTRGYNVLYMDCYMSVYCETYPANDPTRLNVVSNLGYTLTYAEKMSLSAMTPTSDTSLCSTGYCLRNAVASGAEYLVYNPSGGNITVNLSAVPSTKSLNVEWFNPETGITTYAIAVKGGGSRTFTPPFSGDAVLYLYNATFTDVTPVNPFWRYIEGLYNAGITGGCSSSPPQYCPDSSVTRAQMAVFLLRGIHGSSYGPPAVGIATGFGDVSTSYWAAAWIKQLAVEGITSGCGGGNYCPEFPVTRAQMAVFLLKAKHGSSYSPPTVGNSTGFGDVSITHWAAAWIKQLAAEGITSGCGGGNYCPESPVTRAQMAVFLVRTFGLPLP